jgi:hypothetical protein
MFLSNPSPSFPFPVSISEIRFAHLLLPSWLPHSSYRCLQQIHPLLHLPVAFLDFDHELHHRIFTSRRCHVPRLGLQPGEVLVLRELQLVIEGSEYQLLEHGGGNELSTALGARILSRSLWR